MRYSAYSIAFANDLPSADVMADMCRAMFDWQIKELYSLTIPDQGNAHLYIIKKNDEIKDAEADIEQFSAAIDSHCQAAEDAKDDDERQFHDDLIHECMASIEVAKHKKATAQQEIQDLQQDPTYLKFQVVFELNRGRAEGLSHRETQLARHAHVFQQIFAAIATRKPPPLECPAPPAAAAVVLPPLRGAAAQARLMAAPVGAAAAQWRGHGDEPLPDTSGYACRRRLCNSKEHTRIDASGFLRYNLKTVDEFKSKPRWRESNAWDLHLLEYLHVVGPRMEYLMEIHYNNHRASDKVYCVICLCLMFVCVQTRRDKAVAAIDKAIDSFRNRDKALEPHEWHNIPVDAFLNF
jgi:hypothetical protein